MELNFTLDEAQASKERHGRFARLLVKLEQKITNYTAIEDEMLPTVDDEEEMDELDEVLLDEERRSKIVSLLDNLLIFFHY